jgi:23S rRNA (adenine2503-C2)-methyltransferase
VKILRNLQVPTGNILVVQGEHGPLECLSLGDYGQHVNLNQHRKVEHGPMVPLAEKWVITISTQYGCSMECQFCDVPKVGPGRNASIEDMVGQVKAAMSLHPEITETKRLNVHFARMGEPTWNPDVLACADWLRSLYGFNVHPVVSTMMPCMNRHLQAFLTRWMQLKNYTYDGNAGLQLSINSTDENERIDMFRDNAYCLESISDIMDGLHPRGRKITLNFAIAGYQIDPEVLLRWFDPDDYIVKLTPMHRTTTALAHGIETAGDYTEPYPYEHHEEALKKAGYEVLTFIASREEDLGRITCGNAILSGAIPLVPYREVVPA